MTVTRPIEAMLRRERLIVLAGLAILTLLAATYTVMGIGMEMSALDMTGMAGAVAHMAMAPAQWTPGYFILVFLMWWVMMIAMMVPATAPVVLLHAALTRQSAEAGVAIGSTAAFVAGYLGIWGGFALTATGAQWALELAGIVHAHVMSVASGVLAGTVLTAAGLYQLTPIKRACLARCRSPIGILINRRRPGSFGALVMGLEHGAYCLGCCWFLMALLFVGGVMNLYWIAGLAAYVLLEKLGPRGHQVARVAGVVLIAWGAWLMVRTVGIA